MRLPTPEEAEMIYRLNRADSREEKIKIIEERLQKDRKTKESGEPQPRIIKRSKKNETSNT